MNRIVWLASYPKSGNTWFRVFLENYLQDAAAPVNINALESAYGAGARMPFDEALGYESGELTPDEIERLRPEVYAYEARRATDVVFRKVHDAYTILPDGRPLFPPEATAGAIYFVRNPLDVCVSYAHHSAKEDHQGIIHAMGNPDHIALADLTGLPHQFRQRFLTWSGHVKSWVDAPQLRVLVMRYEDMKLRPEETFGGAARFLGWPDEPARLQRAIAHSRFEELRAQEERHGFREKMAEAESFFRKGEIGSWRERLSSMEAAQIVADHAEVMRRFGYLDAHGEPVC